MYTYDNENVVNPSNMVQIETPVCKLQKFWNVGGSVVGVVKTGQWVRQVEKNNWTEKKKKLDRWKGEVGETIRFKHSKFAHKYFRHNQKIIFSLLVSCCGFRPWCQQDRTMRRFEFQSMTIFCIQYQFGATLQYLKVLLK